MVDRTTPPALHNLGDISLAPEEIIQAGDCRLHVLKAGGQEVSRLTLLWDGGSADVASRWLPEMVAEGMREGSAKMNGAEIADAIDSRGAKYGSRCDAHFTGIEILALNRHFEGLLPVLSEICINPLYEPRTVEILSRNAASMSALRRHRVAYLAARELNVHLKGANHPDNADDDPERIAQTTREEVTACHAATIGSGCLEAYICGTPDDKLVASVSDMVAGMARGSRKSIIDIRPYVPEEPVRKDLYLEGACQAAVSAGMPAIGRPDPDYIALRLAVMALGGFFSSRLMSKIREEKGLTYGISAYLSGTYEGASVHVEAQCDAEYVEQVIDETRCEIARMAVEPPSGEELQRLKMHAWSDLASITDSPFSMAANYISRKTFGMPADYFERQLQEIRSLTPERLAEVSARYLNPERLSVVTCSPKP